MSDSDRDEFLKNFQGEKALDAAWALLMSAVDYRESAIMWRKTYAEERVFQDEMRRQNRSSYWLIAFMSLALLLGAYLFDRWTASKTPPTDLSQKIESLTGSLKQSVSVINEIELEVGRRQDVVDRLKQDAEISSNLASVSASQAAAVAQTLQTEIRKENDSNFWKGQIQNLFYAVLGVVLAESYHLLTRRIRRRRDIPTGQPPSLSRAEE